MAMIELQPLELTDIARSYGKVYETKIGEVAYTKLVKPDGFVLLAPQDTLRFYMYRKNLGDTLTTEKDENGKERDVVTTKKGIWELVWGASSIVHDGLPISEELMQWRLKYALRAGKQGFDEAEALGRAALDAAAEIGTGVHKAIEGLLNGKEITLAGRNTREVEHIGSAANFINDHEIRNPINEQIVVHDKIIDGIRIVYAGTTDWIVDIKNAKGKWEKWLLDFKTSSEAHLSHKLQALAYKEAAEQSLGIKIDKVGILLLGRNTRSGYNLVEVGVERGYRLSFTDFVLCYRMLLLLNKGKLPSPSYKTYPKSIKITPKEGEPDVDSNNINSDSGDSASAEREEARSSEQHSSVGSPRHIESARGEAISRQAAKSPAGEPATDSGNEPHETERPSSEGRDSGRGKAGEGAQAPDPKLPSEKAKRHGDDDQGGHRVVSEEGVAGTQPQSGQ